MLTITHTWTCDFCGQKRQETDHYGLPVHRIKYMDMPHGWHAINGKMVCEKHRIEIDSKLSLTNRTPTL